MVKHMISFSEPQYAFLIRTAKRLGISLAELVRRIVDSHIAAKLLILACVLAGCASPTEPSHAASFKTLGLVTFECFDGDCHLFGAAVNDGTGCALAVRGITTVRTIDGTIWISKSWQLSPGLVIAPGGTFGFQAPTGLDTFPEQRTATTTFEWSDVPCCTP